ncbi:CHAD domain-containing protein [Coraliomargarita parva]|uniref:CHAD domain-containing protein n=1 Tax=Coraliomargarita parva TaxID=3014050 RepID=UPI0022B53E8C|nr:CHAD domain-containing protein [Coraliomargarita parva]
MKLALAAQKKAAPQIRKCFDALCGEAVSVLADYPESNPEGLHEARKAVKRLRALLRLLRGIVPDKERREIDQTLGKASRKLHHLRDREVLLDLLQQWNRELPLGRSPVLDRALSKLIHAIKSQPAALPGEEECRLLQERFAQKLKQAGKRFHKLDLSSVNWKSLKKNLLNYEASKDKARQSCMEAPTEKHLHNWRKRLKDCFYQSIFLKERLELTDEYLASIKAEESTLSDARDCDLAREMLPPLASTCLTPTERRSLSHFLGKKQRALDPLNVATA